MKLSVLFIKFLLKPIGMPLLAMLLLNILNPAKYIKFIPDSNAYGFGLSIYMAFFELIYQVVLHILEKYKAYVQCIFYISELDKSISDMPSAMHGDGVFKIKYDIRVSGNYKRLSKCKLFFKLDSDLTAQTQKNSNLIYNENELIWKVDDLLNETTRIRAYSSSISFIKDSSDKIFLKVVPEISKKRGIRLETNGFKIHD